MWPLHGGTLGIWRSSYPDLTTDLNPNGISSSVATYCGIGSANGLPLRGRPGLPLRTPSLLPGLRPRLPGSLFRDWRIYLHLLKSTCIYSWYRLQGTPLGLQIVQKGYRTTSIVFWGVSLLISKLVRPICAIGLFTPSRSRRSALAHNSVRVNRNYMLCNSLYDNCGLHEVCTCVPCPGHGAQAD